MNTNHPVQPSAILKRLAYTRVEAAKLLGVSPISIDRLAARGVLRPSRALRRPLYREDELLRFLTESASPRNWKETAK
jgi:hypothetical protein